MLSQGNIIGYDGAHNNHTWVGIPFAKPPVGSLRWKAPLAAESFSGDLFKAIEHGSACTQLIGALGSISGELGSVGGTNE